MEAIQISNSRIDAAIVFIVQYRFCELNGGNVGPKAYLHVLFFDERFEFDKDASFVFSITYSPNLKASIDKRFSNAIEAKKSGYAYIYFSNESNEMVYFDNFMLTHERGRILEETHYYPFGLTMAGISSKALNFGQPEDTKKFIGQLLDNDLGWNNYQMKWRTMDPQIGRFLQIDPLAKDYVHNSTYAYAENKVITGVDLEGLEHVDFRDQRMVEKWGRGEITEDQLREDIRARGVMGVTGGAVVLDLFVTRGRITQTLLASQFFGLFEHNRAKTPEGRAAQDQRFKENAANFLINAGGGIILSKFVNVSTQLFTEAGRLITKTFSSSSIRFSQSSINGLDEVVTSMKQNGWQGDPIDIVKMKDGIYTTADNTRLVAAQVAGIDVKAVAHSFDDVIAAGIAKRFIGKDGSIPTTWGEAIQNRIQSQNQTFRTTYENGTFVAPKVGTGN